MEGSSSSLPKKAKTMEGSSSPKVWKRMFPLKLLLGLVFAGWLMMWVVLPTSTYWKTWQPKLVSETKSIYFGRQGTNMLIFTFPILFIAVVGCICLHLEQKSGNADSGSLRRRFEAWRKPVLVKGPLGIVSAIELAFCLMFLALLIWAFYNYISVSFANLKAEGVDSWQPYLATVGLRLGLVGNIACAFLFFPVIRGSSLLPLVGLTSESSIRYHLWIGHIVMVLFTAHGVCFLILWAATNNLSQMLTWEKVGESNLAGEISLLAGLLMWATTFPCIRRKMFELFFYTHQLYILFLIFYVLHVGFSFICYILPGVYLFMVDRFLRFLQSRSKVRLVSARLLPSSETVELNFAKSPGCSYNPPSIVFVQVPSISSLQWHPFTVSSNSNLEPDRLGVIIKKEGSWTHKLYHTVSSPTPLDRLDVSVEGPYGPTSMNFLRYDSLVMVSGGSGITPFISIIRELIYRSTALDSPIPSVYLICAFKASADLTILDLLLPISCNASDLSRLQLRIDVFITREKLPPSDAPKEIQTVCFKPFSSDLPIAPVLGPKGWLWLGAIVSSSFVAFLVLIGILTRYYIYPIDHSGRMFSSAAKSSFNILFLCACIAITASAAVLWNKRRSTTEAKKIQNMDASMSGTSPSSCFYNGDQELESVPRESIVKATRLHYGERPNFKKMLSELHGSNIGVMASGPSILRHDVAAVCSSGRAKNLHFESISFSW